LEGWFKHYPAAHRLDLVRRFRSKKQKQHNGAFWELYLHELFHKMGYDVQIHPTLEGIHTHPDFLLTRDGAAFAVVEARLAGLQTDQMTSALRLQNELHDALDTVHSPNFFLTVEKIKTAPTRPTFKDLIERIEKWLGTLNPDLPTEVFLNGRDASTRFKWEHEGWYVSLKVIPKSHSYRGCQGGRSVGIIHSDFQWVDTKGQLRQALAEKANKYGKLNLPFLIAINYLGICCNREDWLDALYGEQTADICLDKNGVPRQRFFRNNDGFWIYKDAPRHTSNSAILAVYGLNTWSMGAHSVEVYQHYAADYAIDLSGDLPCWSFSSSKNEMVKRDGRSSAEILGIPKEWPGEWNQGDSHHNHIHASDDSIKQ